MAKVKGAQNLSMALVREININNLGNKNLVEPICHRHCLGHWVNQRKMVFFVNKSTHSSIVPLFNCPKNCNSVEKLL